MTGDVKFTPIPEQGLQMDLEWDDDLKDCHLPFVFTNKFRIAEHYTNQELPPGYGFFMRLGPKAVNGEWGDLIMQNPIVMFIMGKAFLVALCGICYCVLLFKGHCGSAYSSEIRFQRYWRIALCIILFTTIMYSLMGLTSAFFGIMALLQEQVEYVSLPSLDQLIESTIQQNSHVFEKNRDELLNATKATISEEIQHYSKLLSEQEPRTRRIINKLEKFVGSLERYNKSRVIASNEDYINMVFLRDIFRQWLRNYVDQLTFTTIRSNLAKVPVGDMPSKILNPRVFHEYEEALQQIANITKIVNKRIIKINELYNTTLQNALRNLEDYGIDLLSEVENYHNSLADYQTKLNAALNENRRGVDTVTDRGTVEIPREILKTCLGICLVISFLLLNFLLGLIVGCLGARSSRKLFGMNKLTAAIILRAVIIVTFILYPFFVYQSCKLFYWSMVMDNGYCNISAIGKGDEEVRTATILHSCVIPDTVYTHLVKKGQISPVPIETDVTSSSTSKLLRRWEMLIEDAKLNEKISSSDMLYETAGGCDKTWPSEAALRQFTRNPFKYVFNIIEPESSTPSQIDYSYLDVPDDPKQDSVHYLMRGCVRKIVQDSETYMLNYMGKFMRDLDNACNEYRRDFKDGIEAELRALMKKVYELQFYHSYGFIMNLHVEVRKEVNAVVMQYNRWMKNALKIEIGQCGVTGEVIQNEVEEHCTCMVIAAKGSWTGLFWVLFCLPVIVVTAIALSNNLMKLSYDYNTMRTASIR